MGLLEQACLTLDESHGAVTIIVDGLDFDLASAHVWGGRAVFVDVFCCYIYFVGVGSCEE